MDIAIIIMLIVMFGCLLIGVPIGAALSLGMFVILAMEPITTMTFVAQSMYSGLASSSMLCVPFFMLAGGLLDGGGLSRRLVNCANAFVGNITGGLGMVTILACMFFGAVSGSAAATVAAIGVIMIPQMVRNGYNKFYATGLVAVAGGLGTVVPPSYPLVLYGVTNSVSISDLFLAGVMPACVMGGLLMAFNYIMSKKHGYGGSGQALSLSNILHQLWDAKLAILMPVIVLGGIYSGFFTATESSVVACVYGLVIGKFVYKELAWSKVWKLFVDNVATVGGMMLVFAPAAALGSIFALLKIPAAINGFFLGISSNMYVVMTLIILVLVIAGMFVQTSPIIVILSPILLDVATSVGVDPIHFGMVVNLCLCAAFITPPVAINLFVASGMTGLSMTKIFRVAAPSVVALCITIFIIAFIPEITLCLVK